ncbi:MAG: methylenetetrahydrofolate reductase [NAD(P)H] [Solirubrobacterales bacterium]
MRIDRILATTNPCFSVEFFPPKTDKGVDQLYATVDELKRLDPAFVSVTYGAGGSTRDRTIGIVRTLIDDHGLTGMAHLTCVGATVDELSEVIDHMANVGIENVLALRGDAPEGAESWEATDGGLTNAADLAALVASKLDCAIGGACFPETHPEAVDEATDLDYLKRKVDSGAQFLITQLFFESELYFDFVERARDRGIDVPIIPGVMPIRSYEQIVRFSGFCGSSIPASLAEQMEALEGDQRAELDLGIAWAANQCTELLAGGAPGIHFYALNRPEATRAVLGALRASRPWERAAPAVSA